MNPKLSAYASLKGNFNFATTPLAPPGTKTIVHIDPDDQGSQKLNGETEQYAGPAMSHYCRVEVSFPRTRATTRICDTVTFFPQLFHFLK